MGKGEAVKIKRKGVAGWQIDTRDGCVVQLAIIIEG